MKLYTEDEVRRIIKIAFWQDFENGTTEEDIIAKAHSINLPSDEEISEKLAFHAHGARWVLNRIKQQIKQQDNGN
jgi:hypothetical protein